MQKGTPHITSVKLQDKILGDALVLQAYLRYHNRDTVGKVPRNACGPGVPSLRAVATGL